MHRPFIHALGLALLLGSASACAQVADGLRLSGYGTLGYVQDDRSDLVAIRDVSQRPDDNFGQGSWRRDSRLGLQAEYQINAQFDVVGQVVLREQESTSANHAVELAYLAWKPTAQFDVHIGRVGYDAFLMSDIRNVGYAYPWVRPFTEYYGWIPLFSVNGVDATYVIPQGDAQWRLKAQAGRSRTGIPIGDGELDFKGDDVVNLSVSRRSGPWQVKAGYSRFTSSNEVKGGGLAALQEGLGTIATATAGALPAISAEAADLRKHLSFADATITATSLGAVYDDGTWLVQGEWARTTAEHKIVPHGKMGYVVLGRRFGDWLPFVALSASRPGNDLRRAATDWSLIGQAATQAVALTVLNSTRMEQQTLSLGTRWDFHSRAALKLQLDSTRIKARGYGLVFKEPALDGRDSTVSQLTVTLDFIF